MKINLDLSHVSFLLQDTFVAYFPAKGALEDRIWKGLLVTAFGLGALATMVAAR